MSKLSEQDRARLLDLLDALRDGTIDESGEADLHRLVTTSDEAAALYAQHMQLVASLRWRFDSITTSADPATAIPTGPDVATSDRERTPGGYRIGPTAWSLAAALLLSAAVIAIYFVVTPRTSNTEDRTSSAPIATLIESTGTLIFEDDVANPGSEYAPGTYSIESGEAHLQVASGASVRLRGTTQLALRSDMIASLARGEATFHCPPRAAGYTVYLPGQMRVIDLGTRFRIDVSDQGASVVDVLEGSVAIVHGDDRWIVNAHETANIRIEDGHRGVRIVDARWVGADLAMVTLGEEPGALVVDRLDDGLDTVGIVDVATDRYDRRDAALAFDGDAAVDLARAWPAGEYTAAAWIKPDKLDGTRYIIGVQNSGWRPGRFLRLEGGRIHGTHVAGTARNLPPDRRITKLAGPELAPDRWTHVALVYALPTGDADTATLTLYVDGVPVRSTEAPVDTAPTDSHPNLTLGARPDKREPLDNTYVGLIDDAFVVGRAMNKKEIASLLDTTRND